MHNFFDYPYAVLYLLLIVFAYQYKLTHSSKIVTFSIAAVFVFVAFRAPVVGADTFRYIRYLTGEISLNNTGDDNREVEALFPIYQVIISTLTSSRFLVMVINTIIAFSPIFYLYKNYSFNPPLSFLLFFYLNCTNIYFIGLRQIIGFSFILWALLFFIQPRQCQQHFRITNLYPEKNLIKRITLLLLSVVVGYFFHSSMIIYGLIIILLLIIPLKSRLIATALILGSFVFGIVLQKMDVFSIFSFLYMQDISATSRLSDYLLNENENEVTGNFSLFKLSFIGLSSLFFMEKDLVNHIFTKLFIIGIIIFNLFGTVPMISRFYSIFIMFGCVVFTWIFENKRREKFVRSVLVKLISLFIILYLTLGAFVDLNRWDPNADRKMHPYVFIFQDYSYHPGKY